MDSLSKQLGELFSALENRPTEHFRSERTLARKIADTCGVDIEAVEGGGYNVWPPRPRSHADPYVGDHYASNWQEVLVMVQTYEALAAADAQLSVTASTVNSLEPRKKQFYFCRSGARAMQLCVFLGFRDEKYLVRRWSRAQHGGHR